MRRSLVILEQLREEAASHKSSITNLCALLARAVLLPHRLTALYFSRPTRASLFGPTYHRGTEVIDHGMLDVAATSLLADGIPS